MIGSMDAIAERMYPGLAKGPAPVPFTPAAAAPAAKPIAASSSDAELAARMGYKDAPVADQPRPLAPGSEEERASRMPYEQNKSAPEVVDPVAIAPIPEAVQALRDADSARRLYSPQKTYAEALPLDMIQDEAPANIKAAAVAELREIAADVGATPDQVMALRAVGHSMPAVVTLEQRTAWHEEAVDLLNAEFGQGAAMALKDATRLVNRDPRLAALFASGLGDHPQAVLTMARLARAQRSAGKLK